MGQGLGEHGCLLGVSATITGQSNALLTDVLYLTLGGAAVAVFAAAMNKSWRQRELRLDLVFSAAGLALLLDVHAYAQDCLLLIAGAYIALRQPTLVHRPKFRSRVWAQPTAGLAVIVATICLLNLSALDANWIGIGPIRPVHLLACVMWACLVRSLLLTRKLRRAPGSPSFVTARRHLARAAVRPSRSCIAFPV